MAMTLTPEHDFEEVSTSGRRRKITKFALAGVAVLGVGAALTSAAWSDDVFFGADASTGTLDIMGSVDGVTWYQADSETGAIALPIEALENIGPNLSNSFTIHIQNAGDLDVTLATPTATATGDLFDPGLHDSGTYNQDPAAISFTTTGWSDATLSTNETATIDVIVTGANWVDDEYRGADGDLVVHVQGTNS